MEAYTILSVGENGDSDSLNQAGWDLWDATTAAENVFRDERIRPSIGEETILAVLHGNKIVGAATLKSYQEEGETVYTFSVAIAAAHQKRGLGRKLVEHLLSEVKSYEIGGRFRVWVVNPNMAKLLSRMGFETEGAEWTPGSPHMYLSL